MLPLASGTEEAFAVAGDEGVDGIGQRRVNQREEHVVGRKQVRAEGAEGG